MWGDISLWLWSAYPWCWLMLSIFSCTYWSSVCLLWKKCLFRYSAHFLIRLFFHCWVVRVLYIFWILAPYHINWFANIFSHSIGCLFILLMVSFAVQKSKAFILCSPTCWFLLLLLVLCVTSKKIIAKTNLKELLPTFTSKCFMISGLMFKFLIHF